MKDVMEIEEPLIEQLEKRNSKTHDPLQMKIRRTEDQGLLNDNLSLEKNISELSHSNNTTQLTRSNSCKKNSLKFCRKISKILLDNLNSTTSEPYDSHSSLIAFFQKALEQQINFLSGRILDSQGLQALHLELIKRIWEKNRDILSEKKNNKLSLVNFEEWRTIYSFQGFSDHLFTLSHELDTVLGKVEFDDESSRKTFLGFYSKLLYTLNVLFLNYIIFVQIPQDNEICNLIPEIENFELMTVEPWLYKHYNHTKAKFATECCSNCKICRSSLLPTDFKERLAKARSRYHVIKNIFQTQFARSGIPTDHAYFAIIPVLVYDTWS